MKMIAAIAIAMSIVGSSQAFACPDYIMSCYAGGHRSQTTTCVTYRNDNGSVVTRCTSTN
jgi:hypothetical protein